MARISGGENSKCGSNRELVLAAKKPFQEKIEEANFKIKFMPVSMSVESTIERKGWYNCFFANIRALLSIVDEARLEADTKALAIYSIDREQFGKVNRKSTKFE